MPDDRAKPRERDAELVDRIVEAFNSGQFPCAGRIAAEKGNPKKEVRRLVALVRFIREKLLGRGGAN